MTGGYSIQGSVIFSFYSKPESRLELLVENPTGSKTQSKCLNNLHRAEHIANLEDEDENEEACEDAVAVEVSCFNYRETGYIELLRMNGILYITEGPTDLAALLSIGLDGIARASCIGQEDVINQFIRLNHVQRVCIASDADDPGQRGADKLQASLKVPSIIFTAPAKDMREAVRNGMTADMVHALTNDTLWTVPKSHAD